MKAIRSIQNQTTWDIKGANPQIYMKRDTNRELRKWSPRGIFKKIKEKIFGIPTNVNLESRKQQNTLRFILRTKEQFFIKYLTNPQVLVHEK